MAITVIQIIRDSLKFSSVKAISALIGIPVTIYAAAILVPEEYGAYGFLSLWLMYASLIGPGILSAAQREVPVLLGKGEEDEALRIQNTSISPEMLYSIILFVVILGASFFYSDTVLKLGLMIIAATFVTARLTNFWSAMNFAWQKFNIVAMANLIAAIVAPAVIVIAVSWLRVYALLLGPLIANVVSWIYYLKKGAINYQFVFNLNETIRLLKVGIVLQGLTFMFWAFRTVDRTVIAAMLPLEQLGLYTFAIQFLMQALVLTTDFGNVLQPILWREAGKARSIYEGFRDAKRIAVYMALGAAIIVPLSQLGFCLLVNLITKNYTSSISIFYILSYNLYLASIAIIPSLVLYSSIVNKQNLSLYFHLAGLILSIAFDILVIRLGYGVVGVAWVTICTQGLVTFVLYYFIKGYVFKDTREFVKFQARILLPFLISIPFYFFHNYLYSATPNIGIFAGISLLVQVVLWGLLIGIYYREYLSISDVKLLVREVKNVIFREKNN